MSRSQEHHPPIFIFPGAEGRGAATPPSRAHVTNRFQPTPPRHNTVFKQNIRNFFSYFFPRLGPGSEVSDRAEELQRMGFFGERVGRRSHGAVRLIHTPEHLLNEIYTPEILDTPEY